MNMIIICPQTINIHLDMDKWTDSPIHSYNFGKASLISNLCVCIYMRKKNFEEKKNSKKKVFSH